MSGIKSHTLETLQKKAIRLKVNSTYNAHTNPLFQQLFLLKIEYLSRLIALKLYYSQYISRYY